MIVLTSLFALFTVAYRKLHRHQKEYAALEQQLKGRGSFPVDVWTLGLTLYEVAIGVRPELDGE